MKGRFVFVIALLLTGCVYYNTFYNAKKYFESAQKRPLKSNGRLETNAQNEYSKAIQKCAYIITEHKNSEYADDALFLMGKCYFFQQRYNVAKETFVEFFKAYPESEFMPEAIIYNAKAEYFSDGKEQAYLLLDEFIKNDEYHERKPEALLLLSDYYRQDENYSKAEYYLQNIVDSYPDSKEYETAYIELARVYSLSEDYARSNKLIEDLLKTRVERAIKLDGRTLRTTNYILQGQYEVALERCEQIIKDEYRLDKITPLRILKAKALAGLERFEEAEDLFKKVIEDNRNSYYGAEASFELGNLYFKGIHDYKKSIDAYNQVKVQKNDSPFIERSLQKANIAGQILQLKRQASGVSTSQLFDQALKLAEYYYQELNYPDSALVVYAQISEQRAALQERADSLHACLQEINDKLGKDGSVPAHTGLKTVLADSLTTLPAQSADSSFVGVSVSDSTAVADSSLAYEKADCLNRLKRITEDLLLYDNEFLPFTDFIKIWMFAKDDSLRADSLYVFMREKYPENRYTYAAGDFLQGRAVDFKTPAYRLTEAAYADALKISDVQERVRTLKKIKTQPFKELNVQKLFTVGYLYQTALADTNNARPYYDSVLALAPQSEYGQFITAKLGYNTINFTVLERLPYLQTLQEREAEAQRLAEEEALRAKEQAADSLSAPADKDNKKDDGEKEKKKDKKNKKDKIKE